MITKYFTEEDLLQLHRKEDMIIKAKYNDRLIDLEEFEDIIDPVYGKCFTFNKYNDRESRRALSDYGKHELRCLYARTIPSAITAKFGRNPTRLSNKSSELHSAQLQFFRGSE